MKTNEAEGRKRLLSVKEVAEYLAVSRVTVYELMRKGRLAYIQVGGVRRIDPDILSQYLLAHTEKGDAP